MRAHQILILTFLFCARVATAQYGWQWRNPVPQGNSLTSVCYLGNGTVYAAGNYSTLLKSTNNGDTWTRLRPPVPSSGSNSIPVTFTSISFADAMTGWVAGNNGTILRTEDGGKIWTPVYNGGGGYYAMQFTSVVTGSAVGNGGLILRTTDAGDHWTGQFGGTWQNLHALAFVDYATGIVVGDSGTVLYTNDGGATWTSLYTGRTTNFYAAGISGADTMFIAGDNGVIMHSLDGGVTWTQQVSGTTARITVLSLYFGRNAAAVCDDGSLLQTTSGGSSWVKQSSDNIQPLYAVGMIGAMAGMAVGAEGSIVRITAGTGRWNEISHGTHANLLAIAAVDSTTLIACGMGGMVLRSMDNGATWDSTMIQAGTTLRACTFRGSAGWIVGDSGTIASTTNGGVTWSVKHLAQHSQLVSVSFSSARAGIAISSDNTAFTTTDGGASWGLKSPTNGFPGNVSVYMIDSLTAVSVNSDFSVWRTTDGGITWGGSSTTVDYDTVSCMAFADSSNGVLCGKRGTGRRTTDGGRHWTERNTVGAMHCVAMIDAQRMYAAGWNGRIAYSGDSGVTWNMLRTSTTNTFNGILARDLQNVVVVGERGTILTTSSRGIAVPFSVSTDRIQFGEMHVRTRALDSVKITNNADTAIIVRPYFTGPEFTLADPSQSVDTLAPGESRYIAIAFRITYPMYASSHLFIACDGVADWFDVWLTATTHGAWWGVDWGGTFGEVLVGDSAALLFRVRSTGDEPLPLVGIHSSNPAFHIDDLHDSIAPGADRIVSVYFVPTRTGTDSTRITFDFGEYDVANFDLYGTGVSRALTITGGPLEFGEVAIDSQRVLRLRAHNFTGQRIAIDSITCSDPHFSAARVFAVPAHDSVEIRVTFTPDTERAFAANLVVHQAIALPIDTVALTGTGVKRVGILEATNSRPDDLALTVFPNPVNASSTQIAFTLPTRSNVTVSIVDALGRDVTGAPSFAQHAVREAGRHVITWSTNGIPAGVYFCRVISDHDVRSTAVVVRK